MKNTIFAAMNAKELFTGILALLEKNERRHYFLHGTLNLFSVAFDIFSVSMLLPILKSISAKGYAEPRTVTAIIVLGVLMCLKAVYDLRLVHLQNKWRCSSIQKLSSKVYSLILEESLPEHNKRNAGETVTCVRSDVNATMGVLSTVERIASNLFAFAGYLFILIYTAGWLGILCGAVYLAVILAIHFLNHNRTFVLGESMRKLEMGLIGMTGSSFYAYKEVNIDSRRVRLEDKFADVALQYSDVQQKYSVLSSMMGPFLQSMIQAAVFFLLLLVLSLDVELSELMPSLVVLVTIVIKMIPMALGVINGLNQISFSRKACISTIENLQSFEAIRHSALSSEKKRKKEISLRGGLKISNLSFAYSEGRPIFENAEMEVPAGKTVAVVGQTGEGKTTLLDLVVGLLKPQSGAIMYDDYDIVSGSDAQGECVCDLGSIISYIPQVIAVGSNTVRDVVSFMASPYDADEQRIIDCLKCAKVYDEVLAMPDGLDTLLGFKGQVISGGQKQRLGLARALYKDFELLVMDEATAALDMETEMAVIDSIREMKKGKTLLIVTHHKSLADECEIVYRIENHKIIRER